MPTYAFDIEDYKNFLSVVLINVDDDFDIREYIIFDKVDNRKEIIDFISQPNLTLVGYNILHYDNIILAALVEGLTLKEIYKLSQDLVDDKDTPQIKKLRYTKFNFKSLDTKKILSLDISLKQAAVAMGWWKIQDLPIPHDAIIKPNQVNDILNYNSNDVEIVKEQFRNLTDDIKLREYVTDTYQVNVMNSPEGQMANRIFEQVYSKETHIPIQVLKEGRTPRNSICLQGCIGKNIVLSKRLQKEIGDLSREFIDTSIDSVVSNEETLTEDIEAEPAKISIPDFSRIFRKVVHINGKTYNLAKGGLHSNDEAGIFQATDDLMIIDADVTSYYINIVLNNDISPAHIDKTIFLKILRSMYNDRIEAKNKKDVLRAQALKIAILAVVGKFENKNYWFYDPLAFYTVTLSGQLYLLMLIDKLDENGFEVISANTDGIVTLVPKERYQDYQAICKTWMEQTKFNLEFTNYKKYVRRDVNCYLAVKDNGKVKYKGLFEPHSELPFSVKLKKGSTIPEIVPIALSNWYVKGIDIEETFRTKQDIYLYLMSQRVNPKFQTCLRKGNKLQTLQKTNRYYASSKGGTIIKKDGDRELSILADTQVEILNEVKGVKFELNYSYYKKLADGVISEIEGKKQLSLF